MTDDPGIIHPEPLTGYEVALMWTIYERTIRTLAHCDGITVNGLQAIRQELRDDSWAHMSPVCEGKRANLLIDVCTRLSNETGIPPLYFVTVGDIPAPAPDDASELDTT